MVLGEETTITFQDAKRDVNETIWTKHHYYIGSIKMQWLVTWCIG